MNTLSHTAIDFLDAYETTKEVTGVSNPLICMNRFQEDLPFELFSDAVRAYVGPRQISHFEILPDGSGCSWMKMPTKVKMKELSKATIAEDLEFHLAEGYPKCVIGEATQLEVFDLHNLRNPMYWQYRKHLVQDITLDEILREDIIDASDRFNDRFVVRHNPSIVIDGAELRRQVADFERISFIVYAGIVYYRTGVLMNREWLKRNVHSALSAAYPQDLADNTFKYMALSDETEERINNLQFDVTDEDAALVPMVKDLNSTLHKMFVRAYERTRAQR